VRLANLGLTSATDVAVSALEPSPTRR
jgi:hypothetical protein